MSVLQCPSTGGIARSSCSMLRFDVALFAGFVQGTRMCGWLYGFSFLFLLSFFPLLSLFFNCLPFFLLFVRFFCPTLVR